MEDKFKLLLECYLSDQMTEKQWQDHLKEDEGLQEWYDNFLTEKRKILAAKHPERLSTSH